MRPSLLLAMLCALLVGASACAPIARGPAAGVLGAERKSYLDALAAPDPVRRETRLQEFLAAYPQGRFADEALLELAELALLRGDERSALERYRQLAGLDGDAARRDSAALGIARIEIRNGNPAAAAAALEEIDLGRLSESERKGAYRVLADLAEDPLRRLLWLSRLRAAEEDTDAIALVDVEIDALLERMSIGELQRAADRLGSDVPGDRVLLKLAEQQARAGRWQRARELIERVQRMPLETPQEVRLARLLESVGSQTRSADPSGVELPRLGEVIDTSGAARSGVTGSIGVVLPLSGAFAGVGEESLRGILLAAGVFGDVTGPGLPVAPRLRVQVRDSASDPARAAEAVRELASEGVTAIVGPLLHEECEAAAVAAEAAGVPLVALTAHDEVAAEREQVFRIRTRPAEEVAVLVEHAFERLGARRFAILYPRDSYGLELRRLFWESVERAGGVVTSVAAYEPESVDHTEALRRLLDFRLMSAEEEQAIALRNAGERDAATTPSAVETDSARRTDAGLPPRIDFDVLFVPDVQEHIALIAPQLAYHGIGRMRLLGTSSWHTPAFAAAAGVRQQLEGAVFTTHFDAGRALPFVQAFRSAYVAAYGREPEAWAAQSWDASNLVIEALASVGAADPDPRGALRRALHGVRAFPGVTGVLRMRADGNARKRPYLMGVVGGELVALEPSSGGALQPHAAESAAEPLRTF